MSSPESPAAAPYGSDASGTSVQSSSESNTDSYTDWSTIAFTILWAIALTLTIAHIYIIWQDKKKRRVTRSAQEGDEDVEVQQKSNEYNNEERISFGFAIVIPAFLAATAFVLSIFSHTSCKFIDFSENAETFLSVGLWKVAYIRNGDFGGHDQCYNNFRQSDVVPFQVEPGLVVARVAGVFASLVGGICMLLLLSSAVSPKLDVSATRRLSLPLLLTAVSQLFTFCIYSVDQCSSSDSCRMDRGAIASMTAIVYWVICALGVSRLPTNNT